MKKLFLILAFAALIAFSILAYGQVIGGGGGEVITPGGGISAGDDIVPATSNAYDIGSATSWWKEAWITTLNVSGATINVGTSVFSSASINTWNTPARGLSANMLIDATASTDLDMNTNGISGLADGAGQQDVLNLRQITNLIATTSPDQDFGRFNTTNSSVRDNNPAYKSADFNAYQLGYSGVTKLDWNSSRLHDVSGTETLGWQARSLSRQWTHTSNAVAATDLVNLRTAQAIADTQIESATNTVTVEMTNAVNFPAGIKIGGVPITSVDTQGVVACTVVLSSDQTAIPDSTVTTVAFDVAVLDTHNAWNTNTYLYNVPVNGIYSVHGSVQLLGLDSAKRGHGYLQTGGGSVTNSVLTVGRGAASSDVAYTIPPMSTIWSLTTNDTVWVDIFHNNGDTDPYVEAGNTTSTPKSWFNIHRIGE